MTPNNYDKACILLINSKLHLGMIHFALKFLYSPYFWLYDVWMWGKWANAVSVCVICCFWHLGFNGLLCTHVTKLSWSVLLLEELISIWMVSSVKSCQWDFVASSGVFCECMVQVLLVLLNWDICKTWGVLTWSVLSGSFYEFFAGFELGKVSDW